MTTSEVYTPTYILVNVVIALVGLVTVVLNVAIIVIFHTKIKVMDIITVFLYNLAVADTLSGILALYIFAYNVIIFQNFYECVIRSGLIFGVIMASALLVLGLSIDRYLKISFPFSHPNITTDVNVKIYVAVCWISGITFALAPTFSWIGKSHRTDSCAFFYVIKTEYIIVVCSVMCTFYGCQCLMYLHIFVIAVSKLRQNDVGPQGFSVNKQTWRSWWKPTKVLIIIIGSNLATMMPVGVFLFMVAKGHFDNYTLDEKGSLLMYTAAAAYVNSMLNPILYAFKLKEVKTSLHRAFCCCVPKARYTATSQVQTLSVRPVTQLQIQETM